MAAKGHTERIPRILIVDDNVSLCHVVSTILSVEGFEAFTVSDAEQAIPAALELEPDLILLDVMMPRLDGLEICRRLRSLRQTRYTCVILLTAKVTAADKIAGLRAGADDYLTKPFDNSELIERVRAVLRRSAEMKGLHPLTGLPGNDQIRIELRRRIASGASLALLHVDVDNFKAFNDHYGFLRGDDAIVLLAECLKQTAPDVGSEGFVGHIGGDDFVVIVPHHLAESTAREVTTRWDERVRDLYEPADLERGYIEVLDRQRNLTRFPLLSISIGIASNRFRAITSELELADIAAEMKEEAKSRRGSNWALDRRRDRDLEISAEATAPERDLVLIVDDEADVRSMVRLALEERFEILEAADGMEGFVVASTRRPRWVLLDYMMPKLDGRFAADLIKEEVPEARIIAFSAALEKKPPWADDLILKSTPLAAAFDAIVRRTSPPPPPPAAGESPPSGHRQAVLRDRYLRSSGIQKGSEPSREE